MRAVYLVFVFVLSLAATSVWAKRDYIHAVGGVSFTHAHVRRIDGDLVDDPNSKTGKSWVGIKLSNVEETNRIPLEKGHGFNVQLLLLLLPVDTQFIDLTLSHPSMTLPSGEVLSTQSGRIPTDAEMMFPQVSFTYTLDEDYELVEGDWVLVFSHQGEELFKITFTTYHLNSQVESKFEAES